METYMNYKGYGISYSTFGGTTKVDHFGLTIKRFEGLGEMKGKEAAKKYIDSLV